MKNLTVSDRFTWMIVAVSLLKFPLRFLPFVLATCCPMISYTALYVITSASVHALSSLLQLQLLQLQLQQLQLFVKLAYTK